VGPNGQYRTIQAALDANDSSETDRLVLKITPGDYREKITVTKPGVTFANADVTAKRAVTIRASYYSSNTFDADGKFVPQDEFDLGTNKCATVTIGAGAKVSPPTASPSRTITTWWITRRRASRRRPWR